MMLSIFLAKLLGIYLVVVGALWIFRKREMETSAREVLSSPGLDAVLGALQFIVGLAVVLSHNIWQADWRVVITLVGWFVLLMGVVRLGFYQEFRGRALQLVEGGRWVMIVVVLVVGLFLVYHGFTVQGKDGMFHYFSS